MVRKVTRSTNTVVVCDRLTLSANPRFYNTGLP